MFTRIILAAFLILAAACDTAGADACTTPTPPATTGPDDTGDADTGATGDTTGAPEMTHLGDICNGIFDCSAGQFCLLPWGYCSTGCDPAIGIKDCADIVPDPFFAWTCEKVIETNLCVMRTI